MPSLMFIFALLISVQAVAMPTIQHWQTSQGARVYFVPAAELPMLDIKVVFDAAAARDGDKSGLATLTNGMLEEGAGGLSAQQLAEQFDNVGAQVRLECARDMASVSLRTLTQSELMQPAVETFIKVISQPDFPANALERVRKQMLQSLQYQQQSPEEILERAFYRQLFGEHPYSNMPSGTQASLEALTREDLQDFYARHYVAKNTVIALIGALDRSTAEQLAERISRPLNSGEAAAPLPPVADLSQAKSQHISHPSKQTHIKLGQIGYSRYDADYFPLYVANYSLGGGGLVSRLFDEIRKKRGLAYSVYSFFIPMRQSGIFAATLQTRNEQAAQAIAVLRESLERYVTQGPTAEELEAAKKNLSGGFPLQIDSNAKIASYIAMIGFYGLPLDYLHTWTQNIESVTLEQVREALKRRLHTDKMLLVTVGEKN